MPIDKTVVPELDSVYGISIAEQVSGCCFPRECLSDLLCDPRHRRVLRDIEVHDLAALVVEQDEPEQEAERGRGDHETVDRRQAIGVICKECPPRLPCPEKPEPLAVPTDDGLGPDDYQGVAPGGP